MVRKTNSNASQNSPAKNKKTNTADETYCGKPDISMILKQQAEQILKLTSTVNTLEGKVCQLEGSLSVSNHVNTILAEEIDNLNQYQRRSCLLIEGICTVKGESVRDLEEKVKEVLIENFNVSDETVAYEFDKCHRIGHIKLKGEQSTISP